MEDNTPSASLSTRSAGMNYGLYAVLISAGLFLIISLLGYNPFGGGLNYIGTVAGIVLLVLAQKKFKDSGDGYMSYGQGVGIGLWFYVISGIIGLSIMYIYINFIDYSPLSLMFEEQATKMQEAGTPESTIETAQEWTKKLFWLFAVLGVLFGGLIISLIVSIFTQKKNPQGEMV